ncbi:GSCOCG00011975001-RA-CDS, partial [Cotesia congregata]
MFMGSVDIKDAYFAIPIHKSNRKYLRFRFQAQLYEFTCLPFGFCESPYVFTKLMKPVMTYLRSMGFLSVIYLDDILCL